MTQMIKYYEDRMKVVYAQWEEAKEAGNDGLADICMKTYLDYKSMYDMRTADKGKNNDQNG